MVATAEGREGPWMKGRGCGRKGGAVDRREWLWREGRGSGERFLMASSASSSS